MRPIGGFLPLRVPIGDVAGRSVLSSWVRPEREAWYLHNARSALHCLWQAIRPGRVWLPAYICSDIADAVPAGLQTHFYPLDEILCPDVVFLKNHLRNGDHVLGVDYFGRPPQPAFVELVRAWPAIGWIEDRAQALGVANETWGDWVLYSPRKLLGVPDGGILVGRTKSLPPITTVRLRHFSFVMPLLERFEDEDEAYNDEWYGSYVGVESAMSVGNFGMSRLTRLVLEGVDIKADIEARQNNFNVLQTRLSALAFLPNAPLTFAPFGFPIRVKSATDLAERLKEVKIFAPRHWAELPSDSTEFRLAHQLARELITLPCDYRYGADEMHRLADAVLARVSGT